jgi:nitroreductase
MEGMRDYLATRRSVPAKFLTDPGPDSQTLGAMLTLAARVPDHGKLVPWRFIVFAGPAREAAGEAVARVAEETGREADLEEERQRFLRAPVVVSVVSRAAPHPKIPQWEQVLSSGAVCLELMHAAEAHGFAANWITEWIAYDAAAKAALGIGEEENVSGFIHIGTPQVRPGDRDRPPIDTIVSWYAGAPGRA